MKRILAPVFIAVALAGAAQAQDDPALLDFSTLRPSLAVELAQAAMESCRESGYQVAVAVVERSGLPQVVIRDRYAGSHTIDSALGKAKTAASFRSSTLEIDQGIRDGSISEAIRDIPGALILGGGLPIQSAGSLVGGVGVSGAPAPDLDEACAQAGIDAISDRLGF